MRPKIAMWSDYGAPRHKHWRTPSRRSSRSSIGPKILVAAVVVVAGVIGISGIYPQIIDSEWVQGTSSHSQRVAQSETAPTPRRTGIVAEIPLPPRRAPATTGEAVAPPPARAATPAAAPAPAPVAPAPAAPPTRIAVAPAPAAPAPVAPAPVAPAPAALAPAALAPTALAPAAPAPIAAPTRVATTPAPAAPASPPALSEMRPSVAATEQPAADPDAALAIADVADAQAKADAPADPAAPAAAPAAGGRQVYAGRAPVVKRQQRVAVHEHRSRYSGAYAQWGGGWGFPFFGTNFR